MAEGPLLCPVPLRFFLHLTLLHASPKAASTAGGKTRRHWIFQSPTNPSFPEIRGREPRQGLKQPPRGCLCPAGRLLLASRLPTGACSVSPLGEREAQGGQLWLPDPHDDITALAGAGVGAGPSPSGVPGWALRSVPAGAVGRQITCDTFQEPSGLGLGAEPAVDSCEEMAVRKWLLRLRSRTCCFCWEPHLHFSIFLKYVRAVQECILAITLLKADSEIDRVCCSCFISSQESPAPKTESFLWEVP